MGSNSYPAQVFALQKLGRVLNFVVIRFTYMNKIGMKIWDIRNNFSPELAAKEAALTLFKSGAVIYPTDTLYALGVNVLDTDAVRKLFAIKKRSDKKPLPVMISSINMAKALAHIDTAREKILKNFWPGPFTFILRKKPLVSYLATAGKNTIALRIPDYSFCSEMIQNFEGPITVTSANISGETPSSDIRDIINRFSHEDFQPDMVVDAGVLPQTEPSTIIDLTGQMPKVLRINPTTKDNLMSILRAMQL